MPHPGATTRRAGGPLAGRRPGSQRRQAAHFSEKPTAAQLRSIEHFGFPVSTGDWRRKLNLGQAEP